VANYHEIPAAAQSAFFTLQFAVFILHPAAADLRFAISLPIPPRWVAKSVVDFPVHSWYT
jgi:hypothetical protein